MTGRAMSVRTPVGYAMAGLKISSEIELVELIPSVSQVGDPDVHIRRRDVAVLPDCAAFDGTPVFEPTAAGARLVVPDLAAVVIRDDGSGIDVDVHPDADAILLSHLLVDHAIPRLLVTRRETVLHATCVAEQDMAIAFLGATGTGKSTMALGFCADGAVLVADDCLVVRPNGHGAMALASYPSGRLRDDSAGALFATSSALFAEAASGKRRVSMVGAPGPIPLGLIVALDRHAACDKPVSETLRPSAALWALAGHSFLAAAARATDAEGVRIAVTSAIGAMRWLAESVPVVRITYPSDLTALPAVRDHIRRTANADLLRTHGPVSSPRRNEEVNT